jgi:hypothetical protein
MLNRLRILCSLLVLLFAACNSNQSESAEGSGGSAEGGSAESSGEEGNTAEPEANTAESEANTAESEANTAEPENTQPEQVAQASQPTGPSTPTPAGFEGVREGFFESERFNLRFAMPEGWTVLSNPGEDSVYIEGPAGIQMVVADSQSTQLVNANFETLGGRASFENVNIIQDRTEMRSLNGLPAYRVEGDALLRGENIPVYFVSQALNMPGEPIMATIFIPGDEYFEHSDTITAVFDSMEAIDLTGE